MRLHWEERGQTGIDSIYPGSCKTSICFKVRGEQAGPEVGRRESEDVIMCLVELVSCCGCRDVSALENKKKKRNLSEQLSLLQFIDLKPVENSAERKWGRQQEVKQSKYWDEWVTTEADSQHSYL